MSDPYPKERQLARGERRYKRKVASAKQWQRIIAAKQGPCRVCRNPGSNGSVHSSIQFHHLVPRSQGGDDVADNIVPLCQDCHGLATLRNPLVLEVLAGKLTDGEYAYVIGKMGRDYSGSVPPHDRSAAQDRLLATQSGEYAAGYDAGVQAVWDKWVCSACGFNHDEDESAACEGADVISFADWYGRASDFLRSIREWRGPAATIDWPQALAAVVRLSRHSLDKIGEGDWTPQDTAHWQLVRTVEEFLEAEPHG